MKIRRLVSVGMVACIWGCSAEGAQGPAGPAGIDGTPGEQGTPGADGAPGADGQLRIYGDGSAGDRLITADEDFVTLDDVNLQYENFTIEEGAYAVIASGTVIRCRGTFTNHGTIEVQAGAAGGRAMSPGYGLATSTSFQPPAAGVAKAPAGMGSVGPDTYTQSGGIGGVGLSEQEARSILLPGLKGGGAGISYTLGGSPGDAGGTLVVIADGGVVSDGLINADAQLLANGSGGGGGIVILASRTSVIHAGTINARGGTGGNSGSTHGSHAGGGGGIVHFLAPAIDDSGQVDVSGGAAGGVGSAFFANFARSGGHGGGACGGDGGRGAYVLADDSMNPAEPGTAGYLLSSELDPTALF